MQAAPKLPLMSLLRGAHRLSRGLLAALLALGLTAAVATALPRRVDGPRVVRPHRLVTYRVAGFAPSEDLEVTIRLERYVRHHSNTGGVLIARRQFASDGRGNARVRFRWPRHWYTCRPSPAAYVPCTPHRWRTGTRVRVIVCGDNSDTCTFFRARVRR